MDCQSRIIMLTRRLERIWWSSFTCDDLNISGYVCGCKSLLKLFSVFYQHDLISDEHLQPVSLSIFSTTFSVNKTSSVLVPSQYPLKDILRLSVSTMGICSSSSHPSSGSLIGSWTLYTPCRFHLKSSSSSGSDIVLSIWKQTQSISLSISRKSVKQHIFEDYHKTNYKFTTIVNLQEKVTFLIREHI